MNLYHQGFKVVGSCSMDDIAAFNELSRDLKSEYGYKKVFFDRDYDNRIIIWLIK